MARPGVTRWKAFHAGSLCSRSKTERFPRNNKAWFQQFSIATKFNHGFNRSSIICSHLTQQVRPFFYLFTPNRSTVRTEEASRPLSMQTPAATSHVVGESAQHLIHWSMEDSCLWSQSTHSEKNVVVFAVSFSFWNMIIALFWDGRVAGKRLFWQTQSFSQRKTKTSVLPPGISYSILWCIYNL